MLATLVLEGNHRSLRKLFARFRRLPSWSAARRAILFDEIKRSIRIQVSVEEELLYPTLSGRPSPEGGAAFEGLLQHHFEIEELLAELALLGPRDPSFDAGMRRLEKKTSSYFREARRGPYQEARRRLSRRRLEELGGKIRARMDVAIRPVLGE